MVPCVRRCRVWRRKTGALRRSDVVLRAVAASVDERNAEINQFVQLAVEGASHAGVEAKKVLKHLGTMSQGLMHIARLAAKHLFVNLLHFRIRRLPADQSNAFHPLLLDSR